MFQTSGESFFLLAKGILCKKKSNFVSYRAGGDLLGFSFSSWNVESRSKVGRIFLTWTNVGSNIIKYTTCTHFIDSDSLVRVRESADFWAWLYIGWSCTSTAFPYKSFVTSVSDFLLVVCACKNCNQSLRFCLLCHHKIKVCNKKTPIFLTGLPNCCGVCDYSQAVLAISVSPAPFIYRHNWLGAALWLARAVLL